MKEYMIHMVLACFDYDNKSSQYPEFFRVDNEKVNDWLTKHFGIFSNSPEYEYLGFVFKFNWTTQKWVVR